MRLCRVIQLEQCPPLQRTQIKYLRNAARFRSGEDCTLSVEAASICLGAACGGTGGQRDDVENPINGMSDHSSRHMIGWLLLVCQVFRIRTDNLLNTLWCQGGHKVSEHEMDMMYSEDSESEGCIDVPRPPLQWQTTSSAQAVTESFFQFNSFFPGLQLVYLTMISMPRAPISTSQSNIHIHPFSCFS